MNTIDWSKVTDLRNFNREGLWKFDDDPCPIRCAVVNGELESYDDTHPAYRTAPYEVRFVVKSNDPEVAAGSLILFGRVESQFA